MAKPCIIAGGWQAALRRFAQQISFEGNSANDSPIEDWYYSGSTSPCRWTGVHCENETLVSLDLSGKSVSGNICSQKFYQHIASIGSSLPSKSIMAICPRGSNGFNYVILYDEFWGLSGSLRPLFSAAANKLGPTEPPGPLMSTCIQRILATLDKIKCKKALATVHIFHQSLHATSLCGQSSMPRSIFFALI